MRPTNAATLCILAAACGPSTAKVLDDARPADDALRVCRPSAMMVRQRSLECR